MALSQARPKRKQTGARYKDLGRKNNMSGREPSFTKRQGKSPDYQSNGLQQKIKMLSTTPNLTIQRQNHTNKLK